MKAKGLFRVALLGLAAAALVCGCRERRPVANHVVVARQFPPPRPIYSSMAGPQWEYKTVDADMSGDSFRQQMNQWAGEGWAVLSISGPISRDDGSVRREVRLRRPANLRFPQDGPTPPQGVLRPVTSDTQWEYRTIEEDMREMDLRQNMRQWTYEGWSVVSVSGPIPQDDGTIKCQVKLKRPR